MTKNIDNTPPIKYHSLSEIRKRKETLLENIRKDDQAMKGLWNGMFNKPATLTSKLPSRRLSGLLSTGAGAIDGLLLAWKLYRKFKKKV